MRRVRRLDFSDVVAPASDWRADPRALEIARKCRLEELPPKKRAAMEKKLSAMAARRAKSKRPPRGVSYGVVYAADEGRYAGHVFGYDPDRGLWVRLGDVPMDAPRVSPVRVAGAVALTPITATVDFYCILGFALCCGGGGGGDIDFPEFKPGPVESQQKVHRLVAELRASAPAVGASVRAPARAPARTPARSTGAARAMVAAKLRRHGVRAKPAVPVLRAALEDRDETVRLEAARTLLALCPRDPDFFLPAVIDVLRDGSALARRKAALMLGSCGAAAARDEVAAHGVVPSLVSALSDGDREVRRNAAIALGRLGSEAREAGAALRWLSQEDESRRVRNAAASALWAIERAASSGGTAGNVRAKQSSSVL